MAASLSLSPTRPTIPAHLISLQQAVDKIDQLHKTALKYY
jgi:hypothetical protein